MSELVVVLAPTRRAEGVREVLTDWSAAGIVDHFAWVEARTVSEHAIDALFIERGSMRGAGLQTAFTGRPLGSVTLLVLLPLDGDPASRVPSSVEQRVLRMLESSGSADGVTPIRMTVVRAGDPSTTPDLARSGWHNIVVAPEQSTAPERGRMLLSGGADDRAMSAHAAAALAGLAGLWNSITGSPFDGEARPHGEVVRLARSYYRRLDAAGAELELRRMVTSTANGLPLPVVNGPAVLAVEDVALATSTMAKALWGRHQDVLRGPRETVRPVAPEQIGLWAVVRMFFGFLWAAMRAAPAQWYRRTVNRVSSAVAARVHQAVFGADPAAYAVVVNGMSADGRPADWESLGRAAEAIDSVLVDAGEAREHLPPTDLSSLWSDYASAALTLGDAGERFAYLPPVTIGTHTAVVTDPAQIVPAPSQQFTGAATLGLPPLHGYDVLAITEQHRSLARTEQDDVSSGLDAGRTLGRLREWTTAQRVSFATQVAEPLGGAVKRTADEVRELLDLLRTAGSTDVDDGAIRAQQRFAKALRIITILAAVVLAVLAVLRWTETMSWKAVGISAAVVVSVWLVVGVVTFARNQRELFRILNARDSAASQAEAARRNLRQALRDLKRTSEAYGQFLAWSRIVGAVLRRPLGAETATEPSPVALGAPLPLGVAVGSVLTDHGALSAAALTIRDDLFRVRWLDLPWEAAIESAASATGAEGSRLRGDSRALFAETASGPGSLLSRLGDALEQHGTGSAVADRMWSDVEDRLATAFPDLVTAVIDRVEASDGSVSSGDFLGGIGDSAPPVGSFDPGVLTASAQASQAPSVRTSWGSRCADGLSLTAAQIELTAGIPEYEFAVRATATERLPLFGGDDAPRF